MKWILAMAGLSAAALACSSNRSAPPSPRTSASRGDAPAAPAPAEPIAKTGAGDQQSAEASPELPGAVEVLAEGEGGTELDPVAAQPASFLHDSLDAYESATAFWGQGALDEAVAALDHAYGLMAAVDPGADPVAAQEKENLRQLISKRILEVYASRQSAVGDPDRSIPAILNDDVRAEISSFQGREREFFVEAYRRSGLYRPMIVRELERAGLPEQLSWLPLVESGFKERALSRARAVGLWQFIASTGYRYGLDRSDWIDERMDPEKSTQAALQYLSALHGLFGDWLTALAAYNCGERAVLREIQHQSLGYFDQFWDLYARLPRETRRYVPRFLATLAILEDPKAYGFELPEPLAPLAYETVEVARSAKLESLERSLSLPPETLARLNPELRRNGTPKSPYALKVPPGTGGALIASLAAVPEWTPPAETASVHRVRAGETLSEIADRYRTSVAAIVKLNRLRSANRLSVGQRLQIPGGGRVLYSSPSPPKTPLAPGTSIEHRVRPGDSLWEIAARYGTTIERIRADNGLSGSELQPGQTLKIRAADVVSGGA
jgi:membrane-bound lytic murein transglycosylase D